MLYDYRPGDDLQQDFVVGGEECIVLSAEVVEVVNSMHMPAKGKQLDNLVQKLNRGSAHQHLQDRDLV